MTLWRIAPAANPRDSRWQDRQIWQEVIVRAPSAAMARRVAGRLAENEDEPPVGNESPYFKSGFADEKLYWVSRLSAVEAASFGDGGADGIVRAVPAAGAPLSVPPLPESPAEPLRKTAGGIPTEAAE